MSAVTTWTPEELDRIGQAEELHLATRRRDGGLSRYVTMWVVRTGEDLYVRSAYGPGNPWYRRARAAGEGSVRAGGVERDVTFDSADPAAQGDIDTAYHAQIRPVRTQNRRLRHRTAGARRHRTPGQSRPARPTGRELTMSEVTVVIGAGQIGQAIARRVSAGKHVLLADLHQASADAAAEVLADAGFDVSTAAVDVSSRESVHALAEAAAARGDVTGVIHAAGVSPSQAPPEVILAVDLYGTALVLEEFGTIIAPGGSAVVIASQSGHRLGALTAEQDAALATTPADELLSLPMLQPDEVTDSLHAYQLAKRGNSLRVMAEAVRWGKRGARVNTISPGIIITPLARDELTGPRGEGYRRMLELSPAGRAGTPDEVGTVGALLMGPDGAFITGSDFLMDGGVTASYFFGELAPS
jgi:NAD(P)-dependent dehydrogenase (short-subunit alcohol dehydrogenase family)